MNAYKHCGRGLCREAAGYCYSLLLMYNIDRLQPEYRSAFRAMVEGVCLPDVRNYPSSTLLPDIYQHNSIQYHRGELKPSHIPGGPGWRWNQSKGKQHVKLSHGRACLTKAIPRWRSASLSGKAPSYKMWICVFYLQDHTVGSITWCERGLEPSPMSELRLEDYEFLAPWMPPRVAHELWPKVAASAPQSFEDCLFQFDSRREFTFDG